MCTMPNDHAKPNLNQLQPPEVMLASTLHFWSNWTFVKQVLASQLQMRPNLVCTLIPIYNKALQNIMFSGAMYNSHHSTSTCCHKVPFTKEVPCTSVCLNPNSTEL